MAGKIASTLPINVSTPILTIEDGTKLFHLASCHHLKTTYCIAFSVHLFDIANVSVSQKNLSQKQRLQANMKKCSY